MGLCPTAICLDKCTVTIEVGQVVGIAGNLWLRLFAVSVHVSDPDPRSFCPLDIDTDPGKETDNNKIYFTSCSELNSILPF